jgi:hypothetical protein
MSNTYCVVSLYCLSSSCVPYYCKPGNFRTVFFSRFTDEIHIRAVLNSRFTDNLVIKCIRYYLDKNMLCHIYFPYFNKLINNKYCIIIPAANKVWEGIYESPCPSVLPSVRPSMYLVSATPPKPLIGFL